MWQKPLHSLLKTISPFAIYLAIRSVAIVVAVTN